MGLNATLQVLYSGGLPPVAFTYANLPLGCASQSAAVLSCTPQVAGTASVRVTLTDSVGMSATATATLRVNPALVIAAFVASPSTVIVNQVTTFTVTVHQGTPPYRYSFAGLPSGCASANQGVLNCTPTVTGLFTVTVTVTDAAGATVFMSAGISVQNAAPTPAGALSGATLYVGIAVVIAAAIAGVLLGMRRRRRSPPGVETISTLPPVGPEGEQQADEEPR